MKTVFEKIKELFARYQADWSRKNFSGMSSYVKEPFLSEQQGIFESNFGNNFDIVYEPEVLSITLIEANVDGETIHFKAQINAKMINFVVDETGGVFSGEPTHRSFSEDWSFTYETSSRNLYLTNIEQL